MKTSITPVILAGGSGTRLWPLSRTDYPKQFLTLGRKATLLQQALERCHKTTERRSVVVCNDKYRFIVAEQINKLGNGKADILLEPVSKNTAPAIAAAAWHALKSDADAIIAVFPADHLVDDIDLFEKNLKEAEELCRDGYLVTFGVKPSSPETGYGYMRAGSVLGHGSARKVKEFVEKPDEQKAKKYLSDGAYYWNSGMFVFKAKTYLDALHNEDPEMVYLTEKSVDNAERDLDFVRLDKDSFESVRSDSIDYLVMERAKKVAMVPFESEWSDVGSWDSVHATMEKDSAGNSLNGDVLLKESNNCNIMAESRLVVGLGLENLCVVETPDVVYIVDLDRSQATREIVAELKKQNRKEVDEPPTCYRPWGHYESLNVSERYQVKRITVKPGGKLSLQKHYHRSEHWVVVRGTAMVTLENEQNVLTENQSVYIPLGSMHRLENIGSIPLVIVEVQTGSYLGEDDIVREVDIYGR